MTKQEQSVYEVGVHLIPSLSENEAQTTYQELCKEIEKNAEVIDKQEPESMQLAYPIRHQVRKDDGTYSIYDTSYFASVKFVTPSGKINEMEKNLKEHKSVLRFILITTTSENTRIGDLPGEDEAEDGEEGVTTRENKSETVPSSQTTKEGE